MGQHCVIVSLSRSDSPPQLLLVESPYRLELMFLNAGTIFLMHLSTHTSTISFQSEINGKVGNVDFVVEPRQNCFCSTFDGPAGNVSLWWPW